MPTARLTNIVRMSLVLALLLGAPAAVQAQEKPDPRVADLVRAGRLRVAFFPPQYRRDPTTGEIRRAIVFMEVARGLATRLGIELVVIDYTTPVEAMERLNAGACDMAFLAAEPTRVVEVDFSSPITQFDFTYLVPAGSSIRTVADADRPGVRIAVVRDHGSTVALTRVVKHAQLVGAEVPDAAFDLLRTGRADAFAAPRLGLLRYVIRLPGSRVLADRYGAASNAGAIAKGQPGRLAFISEFIEEAKVSGLLQRALDRSGETGVQIAPPVGPNAQK